jgi:RNA polymerase sigma-70 factor (ECF subfamily)
MDTSALNQLYRKWIAGDQAAGSLLYDELFGTLYRTCLGVGLQGCDAEDVVQETFIALGEQADQYRGGSLRALAMLIARRAALKVLRKRSRARIDWNVATSIAEMAPSLSSAWCTQAESRLLLDAMRRLPVDHQILLMMIYWESIPGKAVATEIGMKYNTFRGHIGKIRAALRDLINTLLAEDAARSADRLYAGAGFGENADFSSYWKTLQADVQLH